MDDQLLAVARSQGGAFHRSQSAGHLPAGRLPALVRRGELGRLHPGVFVLPDAPSDPLSQLRRAQLCCAETLIICGPTAASVHGFGVGADDRLHVTSARARSFHLPGSVVLHQERVRAVPVLLGDALVTDPADTAVDIAATARRGSHLMVLDAAARAGVDLGDLASAVDRAYGKRGLAEVRRILPFVTGLAESPMESLARQLIIDAGWTQVQPQVELLLPGGRRRLDLAFPQARVGVEYDGEKFHTGDRALQRDRDRHNQIACAGWVLLHLTAADIRSPALFLTQLIDLLTTRGLSPAGPPRAPGTRQA